MDEVQQLAGTISDTLQTIGREFSSLRLLIQLGLIVLAAVIGTLAASLIRRRVDISALTWAGRRSCRRRRGCCWPISAPSFSCWRWRSCGRR